MSSRQEKLSEAISKFQREYPSVTIEDFKIFALGSNACREIMQAEIDQKEKVITDLILLLTKCLDKDAELIVATGKSFLGLDFMDEIMDYIENYIQIEK